jgi:hypothetical protein
VFGATRWKEWDIELNILSKHGIFLIGALWAVAGVSEVFAFSIGGFQVQSKFGGKFKASFEVNLDFDGPVEISLGDANDYSKLGLDRQDIMDSLAIEPIEQGEKLRKNILIHSNNPLFFPSFNLVVRATHNGGTLLENFLVTVDFQQSLALNVQRKNKNTPKLPINEPSQEVQAEKEKSNLAAKTQLLEKGGLKKATAKEMVVAEKPESASKTPDLKVPQQNRKIIPEVLIEGSEVMAPEAIVPVPVKTQVVHRRRASGVIWAYPRSIPEPTTTQIKVAKTDVESPPSLIKESAALVDKKRSDAIQDSSTSLEGYVLKRGEGLFSVARKLKVEKFHPAQIAVAIWMNNIDKFIFGNINGIQEGVRLNLENLEDSLLSIDLATARKILNSQAVEWELAKSNTSAEEKVSDENFSGIPLPSERMKDHANLFEQVVGWQTTWENMDAEGHLAYYQDMKTENPFQVRKKRFLSRHPKPRLETSSKILVLKEGAPLVFFEQNFSSETLSSRGLKELEWTQSQSQWKIRGEKFYEKISHSGTVSLENQEGLKDNSYKEKDINLSYVIHVSSHANRSSTVSVSNRLRENGFDAYWAPVRISKEIQIYRVYVGRFSDWNQAHRVVRVLREKDLGGHATAIPYPFALQVGEVNSITEARILLESLRKSGLSGLLLVSHDEPSGIHFRVMVGAFKKADNATWILKRLSQSGFTGKLISP